MSIRLPQNPGIGGLDELTADEEAFLQNLEGLTYAQGDIIYYNGSSLTNLGPGTNGQFLKTQGAGADPVWTTVAGGGDMIAATYDPASVSEQLAGLTATQTLTNKTINTANNTITIVEADISDLGTYLTDITAESLEDLINVTVTALGTDELLFTQDGSTWINQTLAEAGIAAASHTHATGDITSGTFADARIAESNVTQHEAAIDHDALTNFAAGEHFTQAAITTVGTVTTGNVDAVVSAADLTTAGKVELATIAETDTGTDATRAVTPDGLQGSKRNIRYLIFPLVDSATDVATATSIQGDFTIQVSGTILQDDTDHDQLAATTDTAGTTGTMVVDIHLNGTTIMTTNKLDIETTEKGTQTAATQPDLTTTSISAGDILTFDVDAVHTTAAKGLKVYMAIRED